MREPENFDWLDELRTRFGSPLLDVGPAVEPCRECGGTVNLSDQELHAVHRRKTCRQCLKARANERRCRELDATIPPRYEWARLDSPLLAERVRSGAPSSERVDEILRAPRALFVGSTGSGKTSLAVALLREATRRGADAMFVSAYRLATARARHPLGQGEPRLIEAALSIDLLLIDDVGNEQDSAVNDVRSVVFERHDHERSIWITTGTFSRELAPMYGGGFLRRVAERAVAINCEGAR